MNEELKVTGCGLRVNEFPFGSLYLFEGKKILQIDSLLEKRDFNMEKKLKVDLVILSHSPKVYLEKLKRLCDFDEVIFDSSNKKWKVDYWKKDCAKMKIKYWDVLERGAYVKDVASD